MSLSRDDVRQAIFGISDGSSTTIGAMCGLYASGHAGAILVGTLAAGVSATESMGASEFLGDDTSNIHRALAMAIGTAAGGLLPAVPFVFGHRIINLIIAFAVTAVLGSWCAEARAKAPDCPGGRGRAYALVTAIFVIVGLSTFLLGVAL